MDLTVEKFKIGGVPIDVADKQSRKNIVDILQAISSLESSITGLQGSISNIQNDIAGLNDITGTMQDDISSTQSNVSSLQTNVSNLSNTVSSLQSSVNVLSGNVSTMQSSINSLATSVSNLETSKANNTDFNTQYKTISGDVIDGYACNRKGNISLELGGKSLKSALSANTWTKLLTLPSGYRPNSQVYRTFYFAGAYPVIIEINTNGVVKGYSTTALNAGVTCYDGTEFI